MLIFICRLSIISGKFESRKFLVFQHFSSIVQIFHTQLNLSVEKILNNLQSCSFWLYKSNRQHRNSTSIVPNWNSWPSGIFLVPFIWHTCNQFVWMMKNEQICDVSVMCMWCHHVRSHIDVMSVLFVCDAIMLCCISVWYQCYVFAMPSCYVASQCIAIILCCISVDSGTFGSLFWNMKMWYLMVSKKKNHLCED